MKYIHIHKNPCITAVKGPLHTVAKAYRGSLHQKMEERKDVHVIKPKSPIHPRKSISSISMLEHASSRAIPLTASSSRFPAQSLGGIPVGEDEEEEKERMQRRQRKETWPAKAKG